MFLLARELTKVIDRSSVIRNVVRNKPQGIADAMFISGALAAEAPPRKSAPRTAAGTKGRTGSAWVAQLVERVLGKDEVTGSIPVPGSRICRLDGRERRKVCGGRSGGN